MALRCIIVDDSSSVLTAASALLTREGIDVVAVAATIAQALRVVAEHAPDVTLVDIDLGGESGFDLVAQLHPAPTILISTHAERDYADLIAASPALGFLAKPELSAQAIEAIIEARSAPP